MGSLRPAAGWLAVLGMLVELAVGGIGLTGSQAATPAKPKPVAATLVDFKTKLSRTSTEPERSRSRCPTRVRSSTTSSFSWPAASGRGSCSPASARRSRCPSRSRGCTASSAASWGIALGMTGTIRVGKGAPASAPTRCSTAPPARAQAVTLTQVASGLAAGACRLHLRGGRRRRSAAARQFPRPRYRSRRAARRRR
jgi:hypothetical protein